MLESFEKRAMRYFAATLLCVASAFFQGAIFLNAPATLLSILGSLFSLALYTRT